MRILISPTFSLDNFEGTLELLLYLIQKEEIDICTIAIKQLTMQFMQDLNEHPEVEISSETLSLAATLLLLKSQKLLPTLPGNPTEESDFGVEMLQSLLEYYALKERAQSLLSREEEQKAFFSRPAPLLQKTKTIGLDGIEISSLKNLISDLLKKAETGREKVIKEEQWQISHMAEALRQQLAEHSRLEFKQVFNETMSRLHIVVLFLALLEMIKQQEVCLVQENENLYVVSSKDGSIKNIHERQH